MIVSAPSTTKLDFDDLQGERKFGSLTAFGASKAADLILTFELARRLEGAGVTANAVHPGFMRTNLMRQAPAPMRWGLRLFSAPPARAAAAIAPLVLSAEYEGETGRFYKGGRASEPPSGTLDADLGRRLWEVSAALTGRTPRASA